ncbi:hypothetical protein [Yoonia sp.]|jgi:hypothetical protein|uniref:hypothetical protein n=1 Tax=Yoonia sp. TaxID=2212373 RepID=UPI0025D48637|nr:hypothetical protein [Yoonia sp.]
MSSIDPTTAPSTTPPATGSTTPPATGTMEDMMEALIYQTVIKFHMEKMREEKEEEGE